jgi:hypothetical protein
MFHVYLFYCFVYVCSVLCCHYMRGQIHQCKNGHRMCNHCFLKIKKNEFGNIETLLIVNNKDINKYIIYTYIYTYVY